MRQPRYGSIFAGHDDGEEMAEAARVLWVEYKAELESRDLWNPSRGKILDRLVRAMVEYNQLHPQAVALGPVAIADNGNQYFNYVWSAVQKLDDKIQKLEKSLLLTPESMGDRAPVKRKDFIPTGADKYLGRQEKAH